METNVLYRGQNGFLPRRLQRIKVCLLAAASRKQCADACRVRTPQTNMEHHKGPCEDYCP